MGQFKNQIRLRQITKPVHDPITEQEAWDHLRVPLIASGSPAVSAPTDRALIKRLITAATEMLDGPKGTLRRCLLNQEYEAVFQGFPVGRVLTIPFGGVHDIVSVQYYDGAGVLQTLQPTKTWPDTQTEPASLALRDGEAWPDTKPEINTVGVRFISGFGMSREDVPQRIRQAVLLILADLYENRDAQHTGQAYQVNKTVEALVADYAFHGGLQ